ncbi:MAG TPA: alpha-N-acetylglucosaminidase TIM-barrel domain-containing protein, partial [Flavisolibacter sp.]|nr:alpha-N-acetylglucosaminidase TIM-barrel domain-containing protein [Flavisolibacter sp.]
MIMLNAGAQEFKPLEELIARRMPGLSNKVQFQLIEHVQKDTASYLVAGTQLSIHASNKSAAAYALKDYLKRFCFSSFSHMGDQIQVPESLPQTKTVITVSANNPIRFALNYCTISYTMSFYGWKEWERELDWMALNGVNLMLT